MIWLRTLAALLVVIVPTAAFCCGLIWLHHRKFGA